MKKEKKYTYIIWILIYFADVAFSFILLKDINTGYAEKIMLVIIMSFLLWFIMYNISLIIKKIYAHRKTDKFMGIYFINILSATVVFFIFIGKKALYGNYGQLIVLCAGELFCLYGGVCIRRLSQIFENEEEIKSKLTEMRARIHELQSDYLEIINYKENIGYMRHDIANHIGFMESVLPENSREIGELREIKNNIQKTEEIKYCENQMLDIAFEKKLRQLEENGIRVETDIRLKNIKYIEYENLCLLMWMLIDNIGKHLVKNESIKIKVFEKSTGTQSVTISFLIKGYSGKINQHVLKSGMEMKTIEYLLKTMDGSIIVSDDEMCVVEAGMVEVKYLGE